MATFNEVFERTEKKYRVSAEQRAAFAPFLNAHLQPDVYGQSTVTSLYLDTPTNDLICRSLEKPLYKEKIRLRRYGTLSSMSGLNDVFLEIKKKYKGVVYKRRVRLSWKAAKAFLGGARYEDAVRAFPLENPEWAQESLSFRSIQISKEIEAFALAHAPLEVSMSTACDRTAFCESQAPAPIPLSRAGAGESLMQGQTAPLAVGAQASPSSGLRITFDDNIRYCDFRNTSAPLTERPLLPAGESIMEIKVSGSMPLWLTRSLSYCDIRPTSFSKYGESFKAVAAQGAQSA